MNTERLDELWKQVEHIGEVEHLDYDAMLALGSVFGEMRAEIQRLQDTEKPTELEQQYTITYQDKMNHQWSSQFVFNDFNTAKEYLLKQGFVEKNRTFERIDYNWCKYMKAYISPRKIYLNPSEGL
jgi:hypothetical protein